MEQVREGGCVLAGLAEEVGQSRVCGVGWFAGPVAGVGPVEGFLYGVGAQAEGQLERAFVVGWPVFAVLLVSAGTIA